MYAQHFVLSNPDMCPVLEFQLAASVTAEPSNEYQSYARIDSETNDITIDFYRLLEDIEMEK